MSINIVNKADAPEPPYICELVSYQPEATPFVLYGLWLKSQKYFWNSPADWETAKSLLAQVGSELLMPCGIDIVNGLDRIYNLLDVRLAGIERTVTGSGTSDDPFVYDPILYQTPEIFDDEPISLIGLATTGKRAWKNLLDGVTSPDFADSRSFRDQLEAIRAILADTELDGDEIEGILNLILLALA